MLAGQTGSLSWSVIEKEPGAMVVEAGERGHVARSH
jgi:hypothetical protein